MELFKLLGTIAIENDEANQAVDETTDKASTSESKITSAFKKIGAAIATYFAVDKIISFGRACVDAAAEVAAENAAFEQIMGSYSDNAQKKINEIADATGITASRLTPYMTSMTAKFKGLGFDIDDSTDMAQQGLTIAADAAAFWDKSLDDSMGSLNSFINGNYEGGEAIGLFANETTLASWASENLGLNWKDLTEKDKQFARMQFAQAMQDASGAAGQAAKESGAYANVQGNLNEAWRQFKAEIGDPILNTFLIPAMKLLADDVLPSVQSKVKSVTTWFSKNQSTVQAWAAVIVGATVAVAAFTLVMKWSSIMSAATNAVKKAKTAMIAFNAVLSANPVGLVIAAIAGLVAAFIYLWNNNKEFRAFWINMWEKIKSATSSAVSWISGKFGNLKAGFDTVKNVFDNIQKAISDKMDSAKNKVKDVIDKIKGFFNFKWKLPDLKMPKFSTSGKFSLNPPSVPKFNLKWNAEGGVLTKPTIFGMSGDTFMGGGEAGKEAVLPVNTLKTYINDSVNSRNNELIEAFEMQISRLILFLQNNMPADYKIMLDTGILAGQLAPEMDSRLADIYRNNLRGNTR